MPNKKQQVFSLNFIKSYFVREEAFQINKYFLHH